MTEVPHVEARLALAPIVLLLVTGVCLFGGAMFVASRRPGAAGTIVLGLLGCALAFFALMGFGVVGSRAEVYRTPPTVAYAPPTPVLHPPQAVAVPALPPGSGMTRILGPDEVPSADGSGSVPSVQPPVEATRPSAEIDVSVLTQATPEWVAAGTVREGDRTYVVVSGQQFADQSIALQDALNRATATVRRDFENAFRPFGTWLLDPNEARSVAVRNTHTEEIRRSAGDNEFTVYRTHLRVELSPAVREAIEPIWRQQVSTGRSALVGGLLGLLAAVAAVLAGYFRLDDRTAGRYRWRLRVGSIAAVALATSFVLGGLATVPIKSVTTLAVPVPAEAMPPLVAPTEVAPPEAPRPPVPDDQPQAGAPSREVVAHFGRYPFGRRDCRD